MRASVVLQNLLWCNERVTPVMIRGRKGRNEERERQTERELVGPMILDTDLDCALEDYMIVSLIKLTSIS